MENEKIEEDFKKKEIKGMFGGPILPLIVKLSAPIFAVVGILGRSLFQGIGYPIPALIITLLRLLLISVPAVMVYVYVFNLGMYGVWFGLITGNAAGALISLVWGTRTIYLLEKKRITIRKS